MKKTMGKVLVVLVSVFTFVLALTGSDCMMLRAAEQQDVRENETDDSPEVYIDNYSVEEEVINVFVNQNRENTSWITPENTSLKFGSKELEGFELKQFSDNPVNITYKCVIDVSGSMDQKRVDQAKEIIKVIAENKRPDDTVTITAMANDLVRSDYMTDPALIVEKVSGVTRTREDTNLYYGIVEEIKALQKDDAVADKRCLILFSDGADDQATGITREEATKAVTESHIPVFTVALPKNAAAKNDQEMAKILGSFARLSSGGQHYYSPDLKEDELPQVGKKIVDSLNNSVILTENIRELDTEEKAHELRLQVNAGGKTADSVVDVAESDVKRIKEIQEVLTEESVVPSETPVVEEIVVEEPRRDLIFGMEPLYFYLICGGLLLLLILLAVIFAVIRNRKKNEPEEFPQDDEAGDYVNVDDIGVTGGISDLNGVTAAMDGHDAGVTVGFDKTPSGSGKIFHVTLTRMGKDTDKQNSFNFDLVDKYTLGRSASKSKLAFPEDSALSSVHCTFYVHDKKIFVRDEKSTNGTFVNGVPISGPYALEKDDTMIIGSYEYRINWK